MPRPHGSPPRAMGLYMHAFYRGEATALIAYHIRVQCPCFLPVTMPRRSIKERMSIALATSPFASMSPDLRVSAVQYLPELPSAPMSSPPAHVSFCVKHNPSHQPQVDKPHYGKSADRCCSDPHCPPSARQPIGVARYLHR